MRKVNYFKLALDFLMLMVFLILFNTRLIAGQTFHEIAGLAIGLAFIVHLSINWRWIKQVTVNIFRRITNRARLAYVVDVLLLITMGYIVVSGILISKVLFPDLNGGNNSFFRNNPSLGILLCPSASGYSSRTALALGQGDHEKNVRHQTEKDHAGIHCQSSSGYRSGLWSLHHLFNELFR